MRTTIELQRKLGQVDISKIKFDLKCRDEIPRILMGLQEIYCNGEIREKVFKILEKLIPPKINVDNGRPGMDLWKILVLGCVRLICNWDYDKLHDIANNHEKIREMVGFGMMDKEKKFSLQTIKDNVSLFTPEILESINHIVVEYGHVILKGKKNAELKLKGRCDSFVVETDVHFPTDINLLFDAVRKVMTLITRLCEKFDFKGWRNSTDNIKKVKNLFDKARRLKHSNSQDTTQVAKKEEKIKEAHLAYISLVEFNLERADQSLEEIKNTGALGMDELSKIIEIERYMEHAYRQIDQIRRRMINGESIPHKEKVFSIFEEYTEWISKGKAGVPQELGLKVCILEDQYGFILHHRVMERETDDKVALAMVMETKSKYGSLESCSFDKGFHSPNNQKELREMLDFVILPKRGKLSRSDKLIEYSEEFVVGRHMHSGVESAINALENHGLDRCLDHGLSGFKRYVSFAVLARNIEKLGTIVRDQKVKCLKRKEKKKLVKGGVGLEKLKAA